jgi:hypothetical protein
MSVRSGGFLRFGVLLLAQRGREVEARGTGLAGAVVILCFLGAIAAAIFRFVLVLATAALLTSIAAASSASSATDACTEAAATASATTATSTATASTAATATPLASATAAATAAAATAASSSTSTAAGHLLFGRLRRAQRRNAQRGYPQCSWSASALGEREAHRRRAHALYCLNPGVGANALLCALCVRCSRCVRDRSIDGSPRRSRRRHTGQRRQAQHAQRTHTAPLTHRTQGAQSSIAA